MTSPRNYIGREEIDWKLAEDEAYLGEMLERQRELRGQLGAMVEEIHDLDRRIAQTRRSIEEWSKKRPG